MGKKIDLKNSIATEAKKGEIKKEKGRFSGKQFFFFSSLLFFPALFRHLIRS